MLPHRGSKTTATTLFGGAQLNTRTQTKTKQNADMAHTDADTMHAFVSCQCTVPADEITT